MSVFPAVSKGWLLALAVVGCSSSASTSVPIPTKPAAPTARNDADCRRGIPAETREALPEGWSLDGRTTPRRARTDGNGGFVIEGLPIQDIDGAAFSDDDSTLVIWNDALAVWYRTATMEPLGEVRGQYIFDVLQIDGDLYLDTYRDIHIELHVGLAADGMLELRGVRRAEEVAQRWTTFVAPGAHVRASSCSNCGPKPVAEFNVWIAGSLSKPTIEPASANAVARDGTLLVLDEHRIATRAMCGGSWNEREIPADWKFSASQLMNSTVRFEPPFVLLTTPRSATVVDLERGAVRRFATYGALRTSRNLLAYVAHDASADEPADLVVVDLATGGEVRRWPPGAKPRALSHDGARLVFVRDRGDTHCDLHVVRVKP